MILSSIFSRFPKIKGWAQHLYQAAPFSSQLGKDFWRWYAFFDASERWPVQDIREYQLGRLRWILNEAKKKSRFYRRRLNDLDVNRLTDLDEYSRLVPALSRHEFRHHFQDIAGIGSVSNWKNTKSQTSGTTGDALQFYHEAKDHAREQAAICHQWKRVGFQPGFSVRAEFRGLNPTGRLVQKFPRSKMLRCSILHLKPEHIAVYREEIEKCGASFFHGYPSALYLLAFGIVACGISFPQPQAVLLASETVYDWQIGKIEEAFPKAKLFAHYGCAERTVLAGWCEYRREYHVLPQYAHVEVDKDTSEIIGTNLFNGVNPFIRYRMTDTVRGRIDDICPDCRRPYLPRLVELGGRSEDFLFSAEKGWIPPAIVTYPLKSLRALREIQIVQTCKSAITIKYNHIAGDPTRVTHELQVIRAGLTEIFGLATRLHFEEVDGFEKGKSGKFKWIICELDELPNRMGT